METDFPPESPALLIFRARITSTGYMPAAVVTAAAVRGASVSAGFCFALVAIFGLGVAIVRLSGTAV